MNGIFGNFQKSRWACFRSLSVYVCDEQCKVGRDLILYFAGLLYLWTFFAGTTWTLWMEI